MKATHFIELKPKKINKLKISGHALNRIRQRWSTLYHKYNFHSLQHYLSVEASKVSPVIEPETGAKHYLLNRYVLVVIDNIIVTLYRGDSVRFKKVNK